MNILASGRAVALALCAWACFGQTRVDLKTQSKNIDFSNAGLTKPVRSGNALPPLCSAGELFFLLNTTGAGVYACTSTNTWGAPGLPAVAGNAGKLLGTDGTSALWQSLSGDVQGSPAAVTVTGLQGKPVAGAAPAPGQILQWNGTNWAPISVNSTPNYSKPFSAATSVGILGSEHNQGTANLIVACWDNSTPSNWIEPDTVQVDPATFNVTVRFTGAQTGKCVVNGTGGFAAGTGGGGAVSSVFGRTGGVTAQTGDYAFSQISGTLAASQLPASIPVANVGGGSVGAAAFNAIANVTSDVQAQLNNKAALTHTHIGGGDLYGDVANTTVVALQRNPVSSIPPTNGQVLSWNSVANQWQPASPSAGGGSGASSTAQLTDLTVTLTTTTSLTIGANCSSAAPCNVRFGTTVVSVIASAAVTLSAGTGVAYFYITSDGAINAGSTSLSLQCTGCTVQSNIAQFPVNTLSLATWTAQNGVWQAGTDRRAFQSLKIITGGSGIALVDSGTQTTVGIDPGVVPTFLSNSASITFPVTGNAACAADQTFSLPGALPGDGVAPGWPPLPAGTFGTMWISANDTVSARLCNLSGSAVTPGSVTVRATVVRSF